MTCILCGCSWYSATVLDEVALAQQVKLCKANYSAKNARQRAGLDSVKGVGRHGPSKLTAQQLDGAGVCMGPMASDPNFTSGDLLCFSQPALCAHTRDADQVLGAHYL